MTVRMFYILGRVAQHFRTTTTHTHTSEAHLGRCLVLRICASSSSTALYRPRKGTVGDTPNAACFSHAQVSSTCATRAAVIAAGLMRRSIIPAFLPGRGVEGVWLHKYRLESSCLFKYRFKNAHCPLTSMCVFQILHTPTTHKQPVAIMCTTISWAAYFFAQKTRNILIQQAPHSHHPHASAATDPSCPQV